MMRPSYVGHVVHRMDTSFLSPVHWLHLIELAGGDERPANVQLFALSETFFSLCVGVVQFHLDHQRSLRSFREL